MEEYPLPCLKIPVLFLPLATEFLPKTPDKGNELNVFPAIVIVAYWFRNGCKIYAEAVKESGRYVVNRFLSCFKFV